VSITIGCSVFPSALRPRIDGAVVRFPGTGDGVARLVEVSMVKVDIAAPLALTLLCSKTGCGQRTHPRCREWRANQKTVHVKSVTMIATA
jgi:hypothetical protein